MIRRKNMSYKIKEINDEGILFENGAKIFDKHEQD
jgi:hypothetical protein